MDTEKYYFAYGSNMATEQMAQRCPHASFVGVAKLVGYQFLINTRGVATVIPKTSSPVYGVIWRITHKHEETLDKCEGVARNLYSKVPIEVARLQGGSIPAFMYVATDATPGYPREYYLEKIIQAALQQGFPTEYIEELQLWLKTDA